MTATYALMKPTHIQFKWKLDY